MLRLFLVKISLLCPCNHQNSDEINQQKTKQHLRPNSQFTTKSTVKRNYLTAYKAVLTKSK